MQNAANTRRSRLDDHGSGVVLGFARVNDHGSIELQRERQLRGERPALMLARRVIVVRVESALADRDRASLYEFSYRIRISERIERGCIMRVNARGREDDVWPSGSEVGSTSGRGDRLANANNRTCARTERAVDDDLTIRIERRVSKVSVAIDECGHDVRTAAQGGGSSSRLARLSSLACGDGIASLAFPIFGKRS